MGDPFAPKSTRQVAETVPLLEVVLTRIAALGGDQQDVANMAESWPPEPEVVHWLRTCTDDELRAAIARVQAEYEHDTHDDDEQAVLDFARRREAAAAEIVEVAAGNVAGVLEWVGEDLAKAEVALAYEQSPSHGKERSTLVGPLRELLDAAAG